MARAREMAQMAAAGGADAPFGVSCTPAARPRGAPQKNVGDLFVIYQMASFLGQFSRRSSFLIEEKVANVLSKSPPRENGGGCTPSA